MIRRLAIVALLLALAPFTRWAAGFSSVSAGPVMIDNHRQITREAIDELDRQDLDMLSYEGRVHLGLVDASANEAAHIDPLTQIETWASGHSAWEQEGRKHYERGEFFDAYQCFGYVIHLVEDDCSPPHKYVVYHGWVQHDGFEYFTAPNFNDRIPKSDPGFKGIAGLPQPFTVRDYHQLQLLPGDSGFVAPPPDGRRFWLDDSEDDDDIDDTATDKDDQSYPDFIYKRPFPYINPMIDEYQIRATWGSYGGQYIAGDRLPGLGNEEGDWFTNDSVKAAAEKIVLQALWEAKVAAKKKLHAISHSLPPVVRGFLVGDGKSEPARIDRDAGTPVTFRIYENRTAEVFVTVETTIGEAIRDTQGNIWKRRKITLPAEYDGTPFGAKVDLVWKGDLASGSSLFKPGRRTGTWTLRVVVEDADGNSTPVAGISVPLADRGPDVFNYHRWDVDVASVPPYVRALRVTQGSTLVYNAAWDANWESPGSESRRLQGTDEALPVIVAPKSAPVTLEVRFSQPVHSPALTVQGEHVDLVPSPSRDPERWVGWLAIDAIRRHQDLKELQVEIVTDETGELPLDADPSTMAVLVGSTWEGTETGPDRSHKLKLAGDGWDVYSLYREYIVRYIADGERIAGSVRTKAHLVGLDGDENPIDPEHMYGRFQMIEQARNDLNDTLAALDSNWESLQKGKLTQPEFLDRAHAGMDAACGSIYRVQAGECRCSCYLNMEWERREAKRQYTANRDGTYDAMYGHFGDQKAWDDSHALFKQCADQEEVFRQAALRRHEMDARRLMRRRRVLCGDLFRLGDFNARAGRDAVAKSFQDRATWWWDIDVDKKPGVQFNGSPGLAYDNQVDWVRLSFHYLKDVPIDYQMDEALRAETVEDIRARR